MMRLTLPRRSLPATVPLLALALAGCIGAAGDPETDLEGADLEVPAAASALTGITELHWATEEALGDAVLRFAFHFPSPGECRVLVAASGVSERPGVHQVGIFETDTGIGWGAGGGGAFVTAYAGPVDTRTVNRGSGGYAGMSGSRGNYDGDLVVTMVAHGVEAQDFGRAEGKSAAVSVTCDEPFDVTGAWIGDEARLFSVESMDGVGADVFFVGNAAAAATASLQVTSDEAGFYMGHFGAEAGLAELEHPAGPTTWTLPVDRATVHVQDGPGAYDFRLTRAGVRFEAFWGAIYGLAGPLDLEAGLLDESAIEDPFA